MSFSITADLPLGVYRGNRPDRTHEPLPSVARLQAALLAAAGFGPRAVDGADGWEPCEADTAALRWLENHPPTDVRIPRLRISRGEAIAYRDDGTLGKRGPTTIVNKLPKQDSVTAVDGPFVWTWAEPPPPEVLDALRELCPDVSHLGTAESPVVLQVSDTEHTPTHTHAADAGLADGRPGLEVDVPVAGRLAELTAAHRADRSGRVGSDRVSTSERSTSPVPPRRAVRAARYREVDRPVADVPWPEVLLLPLSSAVPERHRVRWAVAAHRALIRTLDKASPPLLTGAYPAGVRRPSNRLALQIVDAGNPVDLGGAQAALAVLVPRGAESSELDAVYEAVGSLRSLTLGRGSTARTLRLDSPQVRAGDRFWDEPAPGTIRLWRTEPAAIPDTRGHDGWTFVHAALLSLGFVWTGTDRLRSPGGRGAARDNAIVEQVNAAGVGVLSADPLRNARVSDYVHRVHPDAVVRPYTAVMSLGDLCPSTTIQAIGQCRHLGGGLLVPTDVPERGEQP
ncbi:type I-G CRISPR-associated protein Csb2 [Pseudonocardia phyllosphaerae]|uniref:type I-G CRISPR-associated protein Csb2 n=1 Tax=Pseudonocardia phyllosphaerae TaxID=3390502 RepID=UPI00397E1803